MYTPDDIRALREAMGLSVVQFAEEIGVHRTTVYHWESGHSHPPYRKLLQLNKLAAKAKFQPEAASVRAG